MDNSIEKQKEQLEKEINRLTKLKETEKLLEDFNNMFKKTTADMQVKNKSGQPFLFDTTDPWIKKYDNGKPMPERVRNKAMKDNIIHHHYGYSPSHKINPLDFEQEKGKGKYDRLFADQPKYEGQEKKTLRYTTKKTGMTPTSKETELTKEAKKALKRLKNPTIGDKIVYRLGMAHDKTSTIAKIIIRKELNQLEENVVPILQQKTREEIRRLKNNTELTIKKIQEVTKKAVRKIIDNGFPISDIQISNSHGGRLVFPNGSPFKSNNESNKNKTQHDKLRAATRIDIPTIYIKAHYQDQEGIQNTIEIRVIDKEQIEPKLPNQDRPIEDRPEHPDASIIVGEGETNYGQLKKALGIISSKNNTQINQQSNVIDIIKRKNKEDISR